MFEEKRISWDLNQYKPRSRVFLSQTQRKRSLKKKTFLLFKICLFFPLQFTKDQTVITNFVLLLKLKYSNI